MAIRAVNSETSTRSQKTSASVAVNLNHPCPLCFKREDDSGVHGMCFVCGQFTCGDCVAAGRVGACVSCGEEPDADNAIKFSQLRRLASLQAQPAQSLGRRQKFRTIARSNLGRMYQNGIGVGRNAREAVRLYRSAIEDGYGPAAFHLGCLLYCGADGVPRAKADARAMFAIAETSGNPLAQYNMALL